MFNVNNRDTRTMSSVPHTDHFLEYNVLLVSEWFIDNRNPFTCEVRK